MGEQRPGGWGLEPNAAVVDAALAGDELATVEACRRGCGPEVIHKLRNRLFEFEALADGTVPAPASPQRPQADDDPGEIVKALRGWAPHVRAEGFRTAAEVMILAAVVIEDLKAAAARIVQQVVDLFAAADRGGPTS